MEMKNKIHVPVTTNQMGMSWGCHENGPVEIVPILPGRKMVQKKTAIFTLQKKRSS